MYQYLLSLFSVYAKITSFEARAYVTLGDLPRIVLEGADRVLRLLAHQARLGLPVS